MSNPPSISPQPDANFELELLKDEYFFVQTTIEDYNKQIWGIKALGLTGTGAVIGLMLQQKQPLIALVGCAIPILFWILESQWKHFQRGFYPRAAELESILTHQFHCLGPRIYGKWSSSFKRPTRPHHVNYWRDGLFNRSVCVTYVLEIAFLLGLYLFRGCVLKFP
jgi:hypothetical protein